MPSLGMGGIRDSRTANAVPLLCSEKLLTTASGCVTIIDEMESIKIYTDGARRGKATEPGDASSAFYIPSIGLSRGKYIGKRTNNEAEYIALIMALEFATRETEWKAVEIVTDSQLVHRQMLGSYRVNEGTPVRPLWEKAFQLSLELDHFEIRHIRGHSKGLNDSVEDQEGNAGADAECNLVLDSVQAARPRCCTISTTAKPQSER